MPDSGGSQVYLTAYMNDLGKIAAYKATLAKTGTPADYVLFELMDKLKMA
jgi:hypothetical protein